MASPIRRYTRIITEANSEADRVQTGLADSVDDLTEAAESLETDVSAAQSSISTLQADVTALEGWETTGVQRSFYNVLFGWERTPGITWSRDQVRSSYLNIHTTSTAAYLYHDLIVPPTGTLNEVNLKVQVANFSGAGSITIDIDVMQKNYTDAADTGVTVLGSDTATHTTTTAFTLSVSGLNETLGSKFYSIRIQPVWNGLGSVPHCKVNRIAELDCTTPLLVKSWT